MPNPLDRRRQPQVTLKAIEDVLEEIHWPVNQTTSHKFISASGTQVNESFGYELKVPASVPVKKVWVGYVSHQKAPAVWVIPGTPYSIISLTPPPEGVRNSGDTIVNSCPAL